ncbi:hypothetical protein C8J57DRAFT_1084913 [Mycena rebaudengoi]|nr:hypothetical protein C8J57DRAFT_1084913 [Mycena rebaudengoi]
MKDCYLPGQGCKNQACGFRDIYRDLTGLDYNQAGQFLLSADPSFLTLLQKEPPYPLPSDRKRVPISAQGADGGKTKRSHFILEKSGKLVDKNIPVRVAELVFLVLTR